MTKTVRAFIAVPLPPAVKDELARAGALLAQTLPARLVRWVPPEKMHLTLRFLGDTAVSQIPALSAALDHVAGHTTPFDLQLTAVGCFPNVKRPRVIWLGLKGEGVHPVQAAVETAVVQLGWPPENRPFQAHLTLGRVKDGPSLPQVRWNVPVKPLTFRVTDIHLIESQLTPKGPLYTVQHTASLK